MLSPIHDNDNYLDVYAYYTNKQGMFRFVVTKEVSTGAVWIGDVCFEAPNSNQLIDIAPDSVPDDVGAQFEAELPAVYKMLG